MTELSRPQLTYSRQNYRFWATIMMHWSQRRLYKVRNATMRNFKYTTARKTDRMEDESMTTFLFSRAIYAIVIRNAVPAGLQWIATADIKEM